jgi:hypothetical protein
MATIINTPPAAQESNSGNGIAFLIGIILLILAGIAFFYYGLPMIRRSFSVPSGTQISVPDKIDVNINKNE